MLKILIVDDSYFSQKILSKYLSEFLPKDLVLYYAKDGQKGFDLYQEHNPDYIFIDLLMAGLNGKDLIELIKKDNPQAKIIVISADVQKSVKAEILDLNVLAFINKPLNEEKAYEICNLIKNGTNVNG